MNANFDDPTAFLVGQTVLISDGTEGIVLFVHEATLIVMHSSGGCEAVPAGSALFTNPKAILDAYEVLNKVKGAALEMICNQLDIE